MGDAACELAEALHTLRLVQLALESFAFGLGFEPFAFGLALVTLRLCTNAFRFRLEADEDRFRLEALGDVSNRGAHERPGVGANRRR